MARRAIGAATSTAFRFAGSQTRTATMSRRKSPISGTVTFQRDGVTRYTKRRMPGRMRRRWKSFIKKVDAVNLGKCALQTFTRDTTSRETWAENAQGYFGYIAGGVDVTGNNELAEIFRDVYGAAITTITRNRLKLYLKSLVMDIQVRNDGTRPMILDVYTLRCRQSYKDPSKLNDQFDDCFEVATGGPTASAGGVTDLTNPAVTVFQNPQFCKYWAVQKKQELVIGGGNVATFQLRLPTNKFFSGRDFDTNEQAIPGYSHALFFMPRGAPVDNVAETATVLEAGVLNVAVQWTVAFARVASSGAETTRQD